MYKMLNDLQTDSVKIILYAGNRKN